jgi:hypothetical protein
MLGATRALAAISIFLVVEPEVENEAEESVRLSRELRDLRVPVDVVVVSRGYVQTSAMLGRHDIAKTLIRQAAERLAPLSTT